MIIFKSRLYFDIKRPPVIGGPTIGGHFIFKPVFLWLKLGWLEWSIVRIGVDFAVLTGVRNTLFLIVN